MVKGNNSIKGSGKGIGEKRIRLSQEDLAKALQEQIEMLSKSCKDFDRGDIVDICDIEGSRLGCGITNYSSDDVKKIKGAHSGKIATLLGFDYGSEVVHRNNLVIL